MSVVSGTDSKNARSRETVRLLSYAENRFDLLKINKIDKSYDIKTWNLKQKTVQLELKNNIYLTIPKRKKNKLKIEIDHEKDILSSELKKGSPVSKLNIYYDNNLIKSETLYSSVNTEKENFFVRVLNSISLLIWG